MRIFNFNSKLTNISMQKRQFFHVINNDFSTCEKKSILTPRGKMGGQNLNSDSADVLSFVNYSTMLNFKSIGFVLLGYLCLVGGEGIGRNNSKPSPSAKLGLKLG